MFPYPSSLRSKTKQKSEGVQEAVVLLLQGKGYTDAKFRNGAQSGTHTATFPVENWISF
jgi:hypothetical protein